MVRQLFRRFGRQRQPLQADPRDDSRVKILFESYILHRVSEIPAADFGRYMVISERAKRDAETAFARLTDDDMMTAEAFQRAAERVIAPIRAQYEGC